MSYNVIVAVLDALAPLHAAPGLVSDPPDPTVASRTETVLHLRAP
jgi:hypothetical protein